VPAAARADIMFIDPAVLVDESDLVVVGKVTDVRQGENGAPNRYTVEVGKVLKGEKVKEVVLERTGGGLGTGRRIQAGAEAVFLLRRLSGSDHYGLTLNYPLSYRAAKGGEPPAELVKLIAAREKVPVGKPDNGLAARAEVVQPEGGGAPQVRFSLKNVSDKPITVCTWVGLKPLSVKWVGPDGKERESQHYKWLESARLRPAGPEDFVTLAPGGVVCVGPTAGRCMAAISFPGAEAGEHTVTVTFAIKPAAGEKPAGDAWVGSVTAPPVTFTVK
jgi:hypothetical protein